MSEKLSIIRGWTARKGYLLLAGLLLCSGIGIVGRCANIEKKDPPFDGKRAYDNVRIQLSFGPRTPGSAAHAKTVAWIETELRQAGWQMSEQRFFYGDIWNTNLTARQSSQPPLVLLCAHYDTRKSADHDLDIANQSKPVPGANDGASGVAVLLEIGRVLPSHLANRTWLVFLDAEDNGRIDGWDWIAGSRAYVKELKEKPQAVILLDMIGDRDLNIYQELNSDSILTKQIWEKAAELGHEQVFIPQPKYRMLDDHIPFIEAGIPSVDIIDFDYSAWHTVDDTLDHVSPSSMQIVGDVVLAWLEDFVGQRKVYGKENS